MGKWLGRDKTTPGAMAEFQAFVAACDAGRAPHMATSAVGTINVMLDGVFNHTSWDAVFGEMGERMGLVPAGQGASTAIGSLRPGWFANFEDYGAPATFYEGPAGGQHDIASAPDRGDFGKWLDTAELFFGNYAALVRHNPPTVNALHAPGKGNGVALDDDVHIQRRNIGGAVAPVLAVE